MIDVVQHRVHDDRESPQDDREVIYPIASAAGASTGRRRWRGTATVAVGFVQAEEDHRWQNKALQGVRQATYRTEHRS